MSATEDEDSLSSGTHNVEDDYAVVRPESECLIIKEITMT